MIYFETYSVDDEYNTKNYPQAPHFVAIFFANQHLQR